MEFKEFIYKLILNYISCNKDMDEEFCYAIIDYFIGMYNLNSNLLEVQFRRKNKDALAEYIPDYKVMYIYDNTINKVIDYHKKYFKEELNRFVLKFFTFLIVVRELVHELTHVYQSSLIKKEEKTLEEELLVFEALYLHNMDKNMLKELNIKIDVYTKKVMKFTKKYYYSLLCERLAEYYAIDFTRNLLTNEMETLKSFYNDSFIDNLLCGYEYENDILIAPTYRVYKGIHKLIGVKEFDYQYLNHDYEKTKDKVKTLDFDTRVKLGLPISNEEFDKLMKS